MLSLKRLVFVFIVSASASSCAESTALPGPYTASFDATNAGHFASYALYKNSERTLIHLIYRIAPDQSESAFIDIFSGETLFSERYKHYSEVSYESFLAKNRLKKVPRANKIKSKGERAVDLGDFSIHYRLSSKCGSPLDSYFYFKDREGNAGKKYSLLYTSGYLYTLDSDCNRSDGKSEIHVQNLALSLSDIWKINENLVAVAVKQIPLVLLIDREEHLTEIVNKIQDVRIVSFESLTKKIEDFKSSFDKKNGNIVGRPNHFDIDHFLTESRIPSND
ncbi:MAG: hypothetical protein C9356_09240 [Oleiphilus sp.]|nr:MAG: hypothetical protein C9356_09240 [Oleiphilus sp.]